MQSIETALINEHQRVRHTASQEISSEDSTSLLSEDTDLEKEFNHAWGYLPPLEDEFAAVLDTIIADPSMAKQYTRVNPDSADFPEGLMYRNVVLDKSSTPDLYADHVQNLPSETLTETDKEIELHGRLWTFDQIKCNLGSNGALFQRTLIMSLIARHSFIYDEDAINRYCLDFSVEEIWTCPPMPTRAYDRGGKFLTQPKPDLAVCFRREALISDSLWNAMPHSTRRLACYENMSETGTTKIFHFFTVETKKANISIEDTIGKRQNLNNASQALHNMFEFFRDAGQQHENIFFVKVRFFSVIASTEGLIIRIHRACKIQANKLNEFVVKDYPLRFEYQEFCKVRKDLNFDRRTVLAVFRKILIAYEAEELQQYLSDAAKALMQKLERDAQSVRLRERNEYYRYGQTIVKPESRQSSSAPSRPCSVRSGSATPRQNRASIPLGRFSPDRKRPRELSENATSARNTRSRNRSSNVTPASTRQLSYEEARIS